ncbi:ergosterol biosynthesis protein [Actinomortierella ambigua]|uniref:Ergosterol biosynthesis protein n=1 Tax=Actinomortierella ambigua TaxID=1343610 RepID=A0A9P6QN66_9FUNG|nr:ergosterol biosynthesis protein [Actinomortierella ambigua]KAG0269625.1 ergosterol biosynthesis protein [Actinomortierella ambigua]
MLDLIGWSSLPAGLLPKWLWIVGVTSVLNTFQAFATLTATRRIYSGKPHEVTGLSGRTFGIWTLLSSVVRLYSAYHLSYAPMYNITICTFAIAWVHFMSEFFVFRTAKISGPFIAPCIVATSSLIWMFSQYDYYVKHY